MKKNLWFFVIAIPFLFTGCVSTPRLVGPPVVVGSTNYTVAQPPVKLDVANKGPQWNRFVRDYQAERLGHNLRLAEIENRGVEQGRAKALGVEYQQPQAHAAPASVAVYNGPSYEMLPSGALRLAPSQPLPISGFVPAEYTPQPTYEVLPNGALRLAPSYGQRWWQFFGGGGGFFGGGSAFGGASFQSGLGNGCSFGNGREKLFGVEFQKSSPGYKDFWGSCR